MDREEDSYTKFYLLTKDSKKAYKEHVGYFKKRWLLLTGWFCIWVAFCGYLFKFTETYNLSQTDLHTFLQTYLLYPLIISLVYFIFIFCLFRKAKQSYLDFLNDFAIESNLTQEEQFRLILIECAKEQGLDLFKMKW